ncbi:MAG: hypothetical protein M1818_002153 [Claussenomyces sp. TS43310]|nr:MAG: hypothetical protein M1818_002153 [Claussenomyces sp. TS43310]
MDRMDVDVDVTDTLMALLNSSNTGICSKCSFMHDGAQCVTCCGNCGTTLPDGHTQKCPSGPKLSGQPIGVSKTLGDTEQQSKHHSNAHHSLPLRPHLGPRYQENQHRQEHRQEQHQQRLYQPPSRRPMESHIEIAPSNPSKLSHACQKRGFNPYIQVEGHALGNSFRGEVAFGEAKTHVIKGDRLFSTSAGARDAVAKQALDFLEAHPNFRARARYDPDIKVERDGTSNASNPSTAWRGKGPGYFNSGTAPIRFRSPRAFGGRMGPQSPERLYFSPVANRPMTVKASPGSSPFPKAFIMPSSVNRYPPARERATPKIEGSSPSFGRMVERKVVNLPGSVEGEFVDGIVKQAMGSAPASICFNLPGNVSLEVAEAYGKAFSKMTSRRRRSRSRSRSRSPPRQPRGDRDRRESRRDDPRYDRRSSYWAR